MEFAWAGSHLTLGQQCLILEGATGPGCAMSCQRGWHCGIPCALPGWAFTPRSPLQHARARDQLQRQPWQLAVCWGAGISCRANVFGTCASSAGLELKPKAVHHTCVSCRVSVGGQEGDPLGVSGRNSGFVTGLKCSDDGCVLCRL